jgi:Tfp pilus assembly protein PilN
MRAVNLIPVEQRRNTTVAGRSGGGAYVLLGLLVVLVALVASYTVAGRQVDEKRVELAAVRAQADQVEADAKRFAAYAGFAELRQKRAETVAGLARSRFDWARSLRELARTIPAGVTLSGLTGSVAPGAGGGGSGANDPMRSALPNPAIEMQGCAPGGQNGVAALVSSLRRMEGVERVSLSSSEKAPKLSASSGTGSSVGTGDCTSGGSDRPKFSLTVFFAQPGAGAPVPGTTQPTSTSTGGTP